MASLARLPALASRPASRSFILDSSPHRWYSTAHPPQNSSHLPLHGHSHPNHGPSPRHIKRSHALTVALSATCIAFTVGALYPPDIATLISPRPAPPLLEASHPDARTHVRSIEERLQSLPVLQQHRNAPDSNEWYETRPYTNYPEEARVNHLTAGALRGPGKIAVNPVLRARKDEKESFAVLHFGRGLCGHDGVVHGGLIATILDESLARVAIVNFPEKIAVTANLNVDYKAPTRADQFVVVRCRLVELNGRKAIVEGSVSHVNGTPLATARALFIQPKYAKLLNMKTVAKAIGEPPVAAAAKLTGGDPPAVPVPSAARTAIDK